MRGVELDRPRSKDQLVPQKVAALMVNLRLPHGQAGRPVLRWRSQNQTLPSACTAIYDGLRMDEQPITCERQQYGEDFKHHTKAEKTRWRELLDRRFPGVIAGVLSCYDRVLIQG